MDAITLLTADHNRVRGLFSQFKEAQSSGDNEAMAKLADRIFEQLDVHTKIEEQTFYPAVKEASEELGELVAEGVEEHHVVDVLIEECKGLEPGAEEWVAKLSVLIENVEHHAEEEEKEMFPAVRKQMKDALVDLAEKLEENKRQLGAPTSADVIDLTKEEITQKARAQAIPGRSSMDQEELALTIDPRY